MIRAVIFDCFGVLIVDALEAVMAAVHADAQLTEQVRRVMYAANRGHITSSEALAKYAELFGMSPDELLRRLQQTEGKDQAVLDFAGSLRPRYKTAVLSNVSNGGLARRFAPGELEQYFDATVVSGEIGFAKPEPEAYETAADRLGVRLTECVMIDDRQEYCDGATAVGMQAIRFEDIEQLKRDLAVLTQKG